VEFSEFSEFNLVAMVVSMVAWPFTAFCHFLSGSLEGMASANAVLSGLDPTLAVERFNTCWRA
jgi:hypothetical protein